MKFSFCTAGGLHIYKSWSFWCCDKRCFACCPGLYKHMRN